MSCSVALKQPRRSAHACLVLHAKHDAAKAWYMQYGFEESPTDPLHLMILLKDVRMVLQWQGFS